MYPLRVVIVNKFEEKFLAAYKNDFCQYFDGH